ncbi:MAG: hypothetical protein KF863_14830 [Rubrivivax sp.]|nr:hypothetical protein [Rubrivivax sp.]
MPQPGAAAGSPFVLGGAFRGATLRVVDSVTEALQHPPGAVLVTGSHGGTSAGRYAMQARPLLAVFNDAGVGKDGAGIAALALLQAAGIAACTVAHDSARIGEAASTLADGMLSFANEAAAALGLRPGQRLAQVLSAGSAGSSPARR